MEAENREQRKQIEELHDERVQTALNEKKRQATHEYRAALAVQVGQTNKQNVLRTLKNYIRAEEKDRQHMLNRKFINFDWEIKFNYRKKNIECFENFSRRKIIFFECHIFWTQQRKKVLRVGFRGSSIEYIKLNLAKLYWP